MELTITLRRPHEAQLEFIRHPAKRKVIRAGRRGGKTTGIAILAIEKFLEGRRILYATPTQEQVDRFWHECKLALSEALDAGVFYKNETRHIIELPGTEQRIRAKTAWNADTLRGDYADLLILDEYQLMSTDAWDRVGAPMLLDNDGDAVFIYTAKRGAKHARDLYEKAKTDKSGRWAVFNFPSHKNPHLSAEALREISDDLTTVSYRMEILAEDLKDDPAAFWKRDKMIEAHRVTKHPALIRVVVGVDPPGSTGTECGIIVAGTAIVNNELHGYVIEDRSLYGSPAEWGAEVVTGYHRNKADRVLGEKNFGGDMVESTIRVVDENVAYKGVHASRGKAIRAEPVAALYENGRVHHVGSFPEVEDEMCTWIPGASWSPNRLDAAVWTLTELMLPETQKREAGVW